jgi:ABC-2 type transport system permease protein
MYKGIFSIAFKNVYAYRVEAFSGAINSLANLFVLWVVWIAIFAASTTEIIGGFTLPMMINYVILSALIQTYTWTMVEYGMEEEIKSGSIATLLLKPFKYPFYHFFKDFGMVVGSSIIKFPIMVAVAVFALGFTIAAPEVIIITGISTILGYLVNFLVAFLVGLWAFWTVGSIWGFRLTKQVVMGIMSGAIIPLYLFPDWLVNIANVLPFKAIFHIPLSIYIGKITGIEILYSLGQQVLWIVILSALAASIWVISKKRLVIQGG